MDLQKAGAKAGLDLSSFTQGGTGNPADQLKYLRAVSGKAKKVGTEEVRGTKTTHYRVTVDLDKYPDLAPKGQRAKLRTQVKRLEQLIGAKSYPAEVWIDSKQLVRRMSLTMPMKAAGTTRTTMHMTMEFFDFGAPVDVTIPPADQVVDISTLTNQQ
jgi:hypothetical protein